MQSKKRLGGVARWLVFSTALFAAAASGTTITGKTNLICASTHVVACADGNCLQGQAKTFDMPNFMFVDFKRKVVHATDDSDQEATSPIKNLEISDNAIILQGFENERGWTLGIDRKKGDLTMSSTGANVNFIVTGNCTER